MKTQTEIHVLYHQIGEFFRSSGASDLVLLRSRCTDSVHMELELALNYYGDFSKTKELAATRWPQIKFSYILLNQQDPDPALMEEIDEIGIRI